MDGEGEMKVEQDGWGGGDVAGQDGWGGGDEGRVRWMGWGR